ncbi:hypothetical protein ACFFK0_29720 [Paenibacillus chartarius]|uniref:Uncharacterized protein n=1 Tax=Paenibacillus chartarius TaxID=747481 RepID=A0ABV6DV98_9BACL
MKRSLTYFAATMMLGSSLLAAAPAYADEAAPAAAAVTAVPAAWYALTDSLQVQVLGVLNEKSGSGVRLGAAVRIVNNGSTTLRIPDHELRLKAADGTVYTLAPSASNAHGVPAMSEVELVYMKQLDRSKELKVTDLSLVDVNYDVYPKQETVLASVPVGAQVWTGSHSALSDAAAQLKWGQPFAIPTLKSPLAYKPVSVAQSMTAQGSAYVVKLLVTNDSEQTETVPQFGIDGKSKTNVYHGTRIETGAVSLEPGESTYIHYSIPADADTVLESLNVLVLEPFAAADSAGQTKVSAFGLGKLNISLAGSEEAVPSAAYVFGTPIALEANNSFVNADLQVSLQELHASPSEENGSRTVFAKMKLENKGEKPIPVPALQTELVNGGGGAYSGIRQSAVPASVQPGTSVIVSYGFVLPLSDTSTSFKLKLQGALQGDGAAAYRSTIAVVPVELESDNDRNAVKLYPYTLNFKTWFVIPVYQGPSTYTYSVKLDMDLVREPQVMLDNNFSTLKIELIDELGRSIGAKSFPFVGTNRLVSGYQTLSFSGLSLQQAESNLTLRISESIATPNGEMNRIVAELKN